ncbi:hypothetical protein [Streptomyces sp. AK02-01A]|uniref:hypothetical protein n=1 Tax=Streptomyces sp. AK02-01A TaxID=3028648 RepID=UPI0029BBA581|nr:hypothetical protein [Streptomyces sp. AK02-01A]MDX3854091.1 hypothetical protein [Streptomyces sp. AK02-01A]
MREDREGNWGSVHLPADADLHGRSPVAPPEADERESLPAHRDDYDLDMFCEVFFQDSDVLMLYKARFDEVENPEGDANRQLGIGDLPAAVWFDPVQNVPDP